MLGRTIFELWAVVWTEYESGWGQRPDGVSFHASEEAAQAFIDDYWKREEARNPSGATPDEYSAPGKPQHTEVSESLYRKVIFEGEYHSSSIRSLEKAKTADENHVCRLHQWSEGTPTLSGKCINCAVPSWEFMIQ